ncbi:AAA family ATPase [Peptococcaceae bacterium 1198_IL3148]
MSIGIAEMLSINDLEAIKKNIMLFKVAPDDMAYHFKLAMNGQAIDVAYSHSNDIVIYLKALSNLPKAIAHINQPFVSFSERNMKALNTINFTEFEGLDRLETLREALKDKLILAVPKLHIDNRRKEFNEPDPYYYNYEMIYISEEKPVSEIYNTIPSVISNIDRRRFEYMLKNEEYVQFRNYNSMMPSPEFVICEDTLFYFPDMKTTSLTPNIKNISTFHCEDYKEIKRLKLPYEFKDNCQCTYQGLHFIPFEYTAQLRDLMDEKGASLDMPLESEPFIVNTETKKDKEIKPEPKEQVLAELISTKEETITTKNLPDENYVEEYEFLTALKNKMILSELYYDGTDIDSFHTAVKTNFITIVGGMSGTGKSQLAMKYCDTLGLRKGDDLLVIPISPSYTEPSDILGYLHPQTGAYVESETGLVSFLLKASKNPEKLHVCIFEEMNLSQVEHWFSPFISLLELEGEHRMLHLVSEKQHCLQEEYSKPIHIGNNVIFIGTVNLDETTKEFSNRLLDRTNLVQLKKQSFLDAKHYTNKHIEVRSFDKISAVNFRRWVKTTNNHLTIMSDEELRLLDRIHQELRKVDAQNGVSFRIVKAMAHFINNIPEDKDGNKLINRKKAFDIQICQRILTKIKGHREMLQDLLGVYKIDTGEIKGGHLREQLKAFEIENELDDKTSEEQMYNNFGMSAEVLDQKAKDLVINGYTM